MSEAALERSAASGRLPERESDADQQNEEAS